MFNVTNRKDELILMADEIQRNFFEKRIRSLERKYVEKECHRKIIDIFEKPISQWKLSHDNKAASLGVCYLFSSLLMRTYKFKIILLGEEFWLDEKPEETMWDLTSFFEDFEKDIEFILFRMRDIFPRLCKAEEEAVRFHCVNYYLAAISQLCRDLAEDIINSDEMIKLNKTKDFYFFFGRFLGEGEILWRLGENMAKNGI